MTPEIIGWIIGQDAASNLYFPSLSVCLLAATVGFSSRAGGHREVTQLELRHDKPQSPKWDSSSTLIFYVVSTRENREI